MLADGNGMYSVPQRDSSAMTLSVDGSQGTRRLLILFMMRVAKIEDRRQPVIFGTAYGYWLGRLLVGVVGFENWRWEASKWHSRILSVLS